MRGGPVGPSVPAFKGGALLPNHTPQCQLADIFGIAREREFPKHSNVKAHVVYDNVSARTGMTKNTPFVKSRPKRHATKRIGVHFEMAAEMIVSAAKPIDSKR